MLTRNFCPHPSPEAVAPIAPAQSHKIVDFTFNINYENINLQGELSWVAHPDLQCYNVIKSVAEFSTPLLTSSIQIAWGHVCLIFQCYFYILPLTGSDDIAMTLPYPTPSFVISRYTMETRVEGVETLLVTHNPIIIWLSGH